MKQIFKKAMTVLGSVALVGATVGVASAASYPAPFDDGAVVVTGSDAAASDGIAASKVDSGLKAHAAKKSTGSKTLSGDGDSFKFEKSATMFHLGDTITGVVAQALDEGELPTLLANGQYQDTDNNEFDFDQKITMQATQLTMFDDNDYKRDDPTVGFKIASGTTVLTYTLDMNDKPTVANMNATDLTFMGKEYYVLTAIPSKITMLDSGSEISLTEGDTKTITAGGKTYEASIDFISSTEVVLTINGEDTNSLNEGETYKLDSGAYVGIKDIRYNSKDTGVSSVRFSIGSGKLTLTSGSDLEINDDTINDLTVTITTSSGELDQIDVVWAADDDLFITEDSEITMPGFEAVKMSFGGLNYPAEEEIEVIAGSDEYMQLNNFPVYHSDEDIPLLYTGGGSEYAGIGQDSTTLLRTAHALIGNMTFDGDTDDIFIMTYEDSSEGESHVMRATSFKTEDSVNKTTFQYKKNGAWVDAEANAEPGDTVEVGSAILQVGAIDKDAKTVQIWNSTANTNFNTLFSREGMKVFLPYEAANTSFAPGAINFTLSNTLFNLTFIEEDKNDNPASGDKFNLSIGLNGQSPVEPSVTDVVGEEATFAEIGSTDKFRSFMYSALATEIIHDKGPDQRSVMLIYHGEEVGADVYITAPDVGLASEGETGIKTAKDSETSMYSGKNMVVIGGSAINTVAADLLGGAYRGEEFTKMTGVAAGGFLIQSFDKGGKTALLVAGYNAADTSKAVDYLVNNEADVDTTVGKKYTGTSATEATLVTNEA